MGDEASWLWFFAVIWVAMLTIVIWFLLNNRR